MSIEKFCDGSGGTVFFYSDQLRTDRPRDEGVMMAKNEGYFGPAPEQPLNNWLVNAARERASKEGIDFSSAFEQICRENPQIREGARMEASGSRDAEAGPSFLRLMRRALEIMKATGVGTEEGMERASVEDPDLARRARRERGGSLYATELRPAPGIGDKRVLATEGVEGALDPGKQLTLLAKERSERDGVSFGEGLVRVARQRPELAKASREQALGCRVYQRDGE